MVWFWGSREDKQSATKDLSPDLKDFLDKQQPKPYVAAEPRSVHEHTSSLYSNEAPKEEKRQEYQLPSESLFQDGRYKHLWKTYVPQTPVDTDKSGPAQRVMLAKKDRREMVHRAALENCVFEDEIQRDCLSGGNTANKLRARMTMCRQETKAFNRCYQLQAKFLQALGYLSDPDASHEDEEKIQMHADKLYHRMMDYEFAVEEAKKNNQPIPPLGSVFSPTRPAPTAEEINLPENLEKVLKKPLGEYPAHERELVAKAVLQEAKSAQNHANEVFKYTTTLNEDRIDRQKWLVSVFGEAVGKFLIPDAPSQLSVEASIQRKPKT